MKICDLCAREERHSKSKLIKCKDKSDKSVLVCKECEEKGRIELNSLIRK